MKLVAAVGAAFVAGLAVQSTPVSAAFGFCMSPNAPMFFGSKPTKPYCAINRSCSEWEVNNYRSEIDSHFRKLRQYADEVDRYYKSAAGYVECMSDLD